MHAVEGCMLLEAPLNEEIFHHGDIDPGRWLYLQKRPPNCTPTYEAEEAKKNDMISLHRCV